MNGPSIEACTMFLIGVQALMTMVGHVPGDGDFYLCAFPVCGCAGRCVACDTYHELSA